MRNYRIIAIIASVAIILLQHNNITSMYSKYIQDMSLKFDRVCWVAIDNEMVARQTAFSRLMKKMTREERDSVYKIVPYIEITEVDIDEYRKLGVFNTSGDAYTHSYEDRHLRFNDMMRMDVLDSIFCALSPIELPHRFILYNKDMQGVDSIGEFNLKEGNYQKFQPLGFRGWQYLQLDANIPIKNFIETELLGLIVSSLMMLLALGCLLFQLTVIRRKEEELKWRDDATRDIIHDLKNPLTTAMTIAEGMKALNDDAVLHEAMDYNYNKFKHVLLQVEELKDAVSEDRPKYRLQTQQVDLVKLAQRVKEECDLLFADKEHSINIVNKLPEGYRIKANPVMVERIMRNLVENGLKYAEHGVRVEVRLNQTEKGALVEVEDNGWGIASEYQKKIFKLYYRIPLEGDYRRRGTGVGLASAKTAVRLHRGKIWMKSELGKGSTFSFTIPWK